MSATRASVFFRRSIINHSSLTNKLVWLEACRGLIGSRDVIKAGDVVEVELEGVGVLPSQESEDSRLLLAR